MFLKSQKYSRNISHMHIVSIANFQIPPCCRCHQLNIVLQETEKARVVREMEERLMSSAFYNLSMHMHRQAVEARLSSATGGQSFLARQRQHQGRPE